MKSYNYPSPIDKLLTLGDCRIGSQWTDYLSLGLQPEHISDLILMAGDEALLWAKSERPEVWAPIHAWRALGQLRAVEAVEPLLRLFDAGDEDDGLRDWIDDTMPKVFELIGPSSIPALSQYLADTKHDLWARITAAQCLKSIGNKHRSARPQCVAPLVRELEKFNKHDPTFNAFIISELMDMQESDAMPLMERAFKAYRVDETVVGDWQDVRAEFGLGRPSGRFDDVFG